MASSPPRLPPKSAGKDALLKFIKESIDKIPGLLTSGKSLTKPNKDEALLLCKSISDTVVRLQKLPESSKRPDLDATVIATPAKDSDAGVTKDFMLAEFAKLRANIQSDIKSLPVPAAGVSYAAAVAKKPTIKTPASRPAIILASGVEGVTSAKDVVSAWRKDVSFKDSQYAPAKVQVVSNGKVRVEFDSDSQRDETLRKLESVTSLKAEPARRRRPLLIIKGVNKDMDSGELVGVIRRQNPGVFSSNSAAEDIKLRFLRKNRQDSRYNAVLEVSPAARLALLELQRVNVDHQRLRVEDYSPFVQCYRCLQFGHTTPKCKSECTPCSHCAGVDHKFDSCPNKSDAKKLCCFNCDSDNKKHGRKSGVTHSATSAKDCPKIKAHIKLLSQRTDYGVC